MKKCGSQTSKKSNTFALESFGVRIEITSDFELDFALIKNYLAKSLTDQFKPIEKGNSEHHFHITWKKSIYELYKDGEKIADCDGFETLLDVLESKVRITIAEFAREKVFLHAGVVAIGGKAIIIPARSFQGKTTLVAALVRKGAIYYSDEYAVLDENGCVHPFPKMLSVRGIVNEYTQTDISVEEFGGVAGTDVVPVALVLISEYKKYARWKPVKLTAGQGIMEMLPHTIPIRNKPEFTLNVLNNVTERAIITKTMRAGADLTAGLLISFFEKQAFKI